MHDASGLLIDFKDAGLTPQRSGLQGPDQAAPFDAGRSISSVPSRPTLPQQVSKSAPIGSPRTIAIPGEINGTEACLFSNRAQLKILTSKVAMHLSPEERRHLFLAIDRLLDINDWEDESSEINVDAFQSYLRFIIYSHPIRIANFGVSSKGNLLAAWRTTNKSVSVEFLPNDACIALIKLMSERGPEAIAWRGNVARLKETIRNNGAGDCID